ncbi:MAG: undecaprenyl/decaprenyl-phosphate alpha-N-acetylglucosaminyl 1-phosphate transferase [Gammaproteobacteria bacterium]|nr:undecaprenyl/decaprenyl-phosphate alpha-N-acetylglucosaminyl 1-phosphate transferase [Gammaproteobacteria bacterium]
MNTTLFLLLTIAVPTSMLVIPLAWRLAPMLNMVDEPDDSRKVHSIPIPRIGGWGIVAGSLLPIVLMWHFDDVTRAYVLGSIVLFLFGAWDDARQLSHWVKFVGQALAAGAVVFLGGLYVSHWPFVDDAMPEPLAKGLTVVALMGTINAINHSDGLDGLAGGETILSLIAFAYLGYLSGDDVTVGLAMATMGGILGFLRYNTHPARVFMGDGGSQFLGFTLGFLAIQLTQVGMPTLSTASPLLLLGLPISDILVVLYKRATGGMNWFKATRNHVHHRLLDLGLDHYETVVLIYSVQALLVTLAVLLRFESDFLVAGSYLFLISGLFLGLGTAEARGWRRRSLGPSLIAREISRLRSDGRLRGVPYKAITALLPLCMIGGATLAGTVPRDFGVVAGVLALIMVAHLGFTRSTDSVIIRLVVYVAAIFSSYLFVRFQPGGDITGAAAVGVVLVLACAVAIFIRYTSDVRFGATPTDYLLVFGVMALVIFGGIDIRARGTVQTVMFAIVMLYACEAVLGVANARWNTINVSTTVCMLILALRGLA